ncbi:MAG TPA: ABC transporter ATP-binding protein [Candidatus Eisenbacteria bacterium]|nr:ABC transporter ATP-binding protein [Candidatus Eisenbacteria bacterium]
MIRIRGLSKRLGKKQVLSGLDLEIPTGETWVIIGRSGTGKSVLLKHIVGLMKPDQGSIEIDGDDIATMKEAEVNEVRKRFGMLFQGAALFDSLNVGDNVGLALREHRVMPEDKIRERVAQRLDWVGLAGSEKQRPSDLSGGMRKRVGLARAIAMDPQFILYDEPTTGLDPITADVIDQLIRAMQRRMRVTSVAVTHDLASAYKIGDQIAMLHDGKVVFQGTPDETKVTKNPLVRQFIEGSSEGPMEV